MPVIRRQATYRRRYSHAFTPSTHSIRPAIAADFRPGTEDALSPVVSAYILRIEFSPRFPARVGEGVCYIETADEPLVATIMLLSLYTNDVRRLPDTPAR